MLAIEGAWAMKFKDILVVITSKSGGEAAIAFGEQLVRRNAGRLSTAIVNWQPNVAPVDGFIIDTMYADLVKEAYKHLEQEAQKVRERVAQEGGSGPVQSYLIFMGAAASTIGMRARHADVVVVARPSGAAASSAHAVLEGALFESGRPVVVVPPGWKGKDAGRSVLIAWKPTREAARALADAADFLAGASRVSIVTVDAKPSQGYGDHPGADIAAHLAVRGLKPELFNLDSAGRSETKAILDQATAVGADLIVMGAYGRPRVSEFIFGGVTRDMVTTSPLPVLMSH
jgi:nucleotide-binding universal stress UspA family protein